MAEVKVLIKGFTNTDTKDDNEAEVTSCTTALVKDGDFIIVTDPGVLADQKILKDALAKEGLTINDVTHVFITHPHMDHYRNIGMFPKAISLDYTGIWTGNKYNDLTWDLTPSISFILTPGHKDDSLTMLVKTEQGTIAIAGDVWWRENYPQEDPYASDQKLLEESRKKILKIADYIVPGHGDMFKVSK